MKLHEFKKLVKEKKLNGVYVISGIEFYLKNQYVERIKQDYNLLKVASFEELKQKLNKKTLTGNRLNNLLLYVETIDKINIKEINFKGEGVILIVSVDDKDKKDVIYFDKCSENVIRKYTKSPYLKYREQIKNVKESLDILGLEEKDILNVGLSENILKEPKPLDYAIAVILGDRESLIMYNFILDILDTSPYIYIITLIDVLSIYKLFVKHNNVFDGTNEAYKQGLNYAYAKELRNRFCRKKTEKEKQSSYGNWITLREIHYVDCKKIKNDLLDLLLDNYIYYDKSDIFNYLTFCL